MINASGSSSTIIDWIQLRILTYVLIGPLRCTPAEMKVACTVLNRPKTIITTNYTVSNMFTLLSL